MTVYTKMTIKGVEYLTADQINLERSIGDFNTTSNFSIQFSNYAGKYDDAFTLGDEVIIYADKDTNPAVTKIFTGIIEGIDYSGSELKERVVLSGRDYGAVLQDMTIQPIVFKERDVGEIAKVIIQQNAVGIVTTNNVDTSTGVTMERQGFNHTIVFDALKELAQAANYIFYVDENKDVHFIAKDSVSSGKTFDNTNITQAKFKSDDSKIFNKVWIYGDRILTGATDVGGIGVGSVFKLTDNPHNTRVFVDSVLQEIGGVYQMDDPATKANLKYLVDFNQKNIVFVSGTTAGDNIPVSGPSNVQVDYERSTPILKFRQDAQSIIDYGPKTKVVTDRDIKDFAQANKKATDFLAENKDPKVMGDIDVYGIVDVTPGNTCVVDIPFHNINSQTYKILNVSYSFNKENCLADKVLSLSLNLKIGDFTDTMKDTILRIRDTETGALEGKMTRLETAIDTVPIDSHYEIWTGNVENNFIFHSDVHGLFESPDSLFGVGVLGSTFVTSGGYIV